jgi:hypothetical protein
MAVHFSEASEQIKHAARCENANMDIILKISAVKILNAAEIFK